MRVFRFVSLTLLGLLVAVSRPAAAVVTITVGGATAAPGGSASVLISLSGIAAGGTAVNNAQLDIIFDPAVFETPAPTTDCVPAARFSTASGFQPSESLPTVSGVQRIRLSVIDNTEPLGGVTDGDMFTCTLRVKATAASGPSTLQATRLNVGDTSGTVLASAGVNGTFTVGAGGPTATPTTVGATATPTTVRATATPTTVGGTATPTTVRATATPTTAGATATATKAPATATPTVAPPTATTGPGTPTPVPTQEEDDDGCQISTVGGGSGWLLLIPAVTLLVLRRRRR